MSQTTPDIRQLSTCCGKVLVWQDLGLRSSWLATCLCGARFWADRSKEPIRAPLWTERLLLDLIAELENALRWGMAELAQQLAAKEAENAELLATLANERGEGEAPVEGWTWGQGGEMPDPCWHKGEAVVYMEKAFDPEPATPAHYWLWWVPGMPCCQRADTARAAIRAASSQGADVPKDQR